MNTIKIDKDVFVRDQYKVRRRAFLAGTEVDEASYNATMNENAEKPKTKEAMENKMLPVEPEVAEEAVSPTEKQVVNYYKTEAKETVEKVKENKPAKAPAKAKK